MDELDTLKKVKSIDGSYSSGTIPSSSVTPSVPQEPLYGMPTGYFAGQTPPPQHDQQTGAMVVSPATPTLIASIPCSTAPS